MLTTQNKNFIIYLFYLLYLKLHVADKPSYSQLSVTLHIKYFCTEKKQGCVLLCSLLFILQFWSYFYINHTLL